jgi:hypothetical protein
MAFCTQCGSAISATVSFCTQCGAQVAPVDSPSPEPAISEPMAEPSPNLGGYGATSTHQFQTVIPQWRQVTRKGWWLLGGALLVFIGSLLPWAEQSVDGYSSATSHPGGGGMIVFLALAIGVVAAGWPLLAGGISKRRLIGATVVAAPLVLFAITNWSDLHNVQRQAAGLGAGLVSVNVTAGSGLVLYTVGTVALCALIVRLWISPRRAIVGGAAS